MGKRDKTPSDETPAQPFNNPFGALRDRVGTGPPSPPAAASGPDLPASLPAAQGGPGKSGQVASAGRPPPARAVVRLERKGRGGKEVTVVEKLGLSAADLDRWLKELKRSLGCGGVVEGSALVLQGDLRDRAAALLELKGVRRVTKG